MKKNEEKQEKRKVSLWWWLLLPIALLGAWLFYPKGDNAAISTVQPTATTASSANEIKVCYEAQTMNPGRCCTDDLAQVSIFESSNVVFASVKFSQPTEGDAVVTGIVRWDSGEAFPTQPILFEHNPAVGDACFHGKMQPVNGVQWSLHHYTLEIMVNGKTAGKKTFEVIR